MSASGRIVGGTEATPHSYPWMAALFVDDQWFCGGRAIELIWKWFLYTSDVVTFKRPSHNYDGLKVGPLGSPC
jgi:hypothetical protein